MANQEYVVNTGTSKVEEAINVLSGGEVKRYHTLPIIGEQTVASHSWGVALIAPTKWNNKSLAKQLASVERRIERELGVDYSLTAEEKEFFKQSDLFELLLYCVNQRSLGNTNVNVVFSNGVEKLVDMKLNTRGKALLAHLVQSYGATE